MAHGPANVDGRKFEQLAGRRVKPPYAQVRIHHQDGNGYGAQQIFQVAIDCIELKVTALQFLVDRC